MTPSAVVAFIAILVGYTVFAMGAYKLFRAIKLI